MKTMGDREIAELVSDIYSATSAHVPPDKREKIALDITAKLTQHGIDPGILGHPNDLLSDARWQDKPEEELDIW